MHMFCCTTGHTEDQGIEHQGTGFWSRKVLPQLARPIFKTRANHRGVESDCKLIVTVVSWVDTLES